MTTIKSLLFKYSPSFLRSVFNRIERSPIGYRLAKGFFWSLAGTAISRGLMLLATVFVARMLGKTVYGELGMIRSTVGMFGVFAGFGLGITATKHVAEFYRNDPARAGRIIGLSRVFAMVSGGLMALGLFIFAPWLAEHTINAPQLTGILRIGSLILLLNALYGAQTGALAGFEAFRVIARINFIVGLISFPLLIGGAYFGGLTGAVWALTINLGLNWLLNHLALHKEARRNGVPFTFSNCGRELPVLWRFSLPAVLGSSLVGPVNWLCSALLVNRPGGYGEMGIFNVANQWSLAIMFVPGAIGQIVLPLLSDLNRQGEQSKYLKVLWINLLISGATTLIITIPVALLAKLIMRAYGKGFDEGSSALVFMAFASVLVVVNAVIGRVIASKGKMWAGLALNLLWAAALLFLVWLLIDNGAKGLALAYLLSYMFHSITVSIYSYFILRKTTVL